MKRILCTALTLACLGMWIGCNKQEKAPTAAEPAAPSKRASAPVKPTVAPPAATQPQKPPVTPPPATGPQEPVVTPPAATQPQGSTGDLVAGAKSDTEQAMALAKNGKYREALDFACQRAVLAKDDPEAWQIMSDTMARVCIASAKDGVDRAMALANNGRYKEALALLDEKAVREGNHPDARRMIDDARAQIKEMMK